MKKFLLAIVAILLTAAVAFVAYLFMINRPLPQNVSDVAIVDRAMEILRDEQSWRRAGDRSCEAEGPTVNLYCALRRASIEVTGEFKHRSAALQQVRFAIERQRPGVEYAHRLMDYNNDPSTSFEDLHAVLRDARGRLEAEWAGHDG